jgi:hypothetical protein
MPGEPIRLRVELGAAPTAGSFDPMALLNHFKARLEKKLTKKGRQIFWIQDTPQISIGLFFEPGNQLLRYLVPFISPAVCNAQAVWQTAPGRVERLDARGAAHFGLFGGSAQGMLKVAATVAADRMAKQLLKVQPGGFEPVMLK